MTSATKYMRADTRREAAFSARGANFSGPRLIQQILAFVVEMCIRDRDLKVLGVVITLFDKRTNISRDTHEQIRAVFGEALFKTRISKNVRLEESPAYKETVFSFAPKSSGAEEYKKLAQEVLQRVQEDRVARHSQDAA